MKPSFSNISPEKAIKRLVAYDDDDESLEESSEEESSEGEENIEEKSSGEESSAEKFSEGTAEKKFVGCCFNRCILI